MFKTKWFSRWARKEGLRDADLCCAVEDILAGLAFVDLGAGLFKKRIALRSSGSRGGAGVIIATRLGPCWFFIHGW
ncbi:MAG: type II toxin-antitoxin system RelE/ParE family toxin, partial [bacterium]